MIVRTVLCLPPPPIDDLVQPLSIVVDTLILPELTRLDAVNSLTDPVA